MEDADLDPGSDEANDFLAGSETGLLTTLLVRARLLPSLWNPKGNQPVGGWRMSLNDLSSMAS